MLTKVAVTGASGHIGNVVCRQLIERGYQVRALYQSDKRSLDGLALELIQGSVLNLDDVSRLVENCEYVIHCAAIISIEGDKHGRVYETNTVGPQIVLTGSLQHRVKKMIHCSSVHAVCHYPHDTIFDESRPYVSQNDFVYNYSKAMGEQILLNESNGKDIEVVIVRPSSVVGPYDYKPSKMGAALLHFYLSKLPLYPEGGYDIVDVRDVAASICEAISKGKNREVYLLSGKYYTFKEILTTINQLRNKRTPSIMVPFWLLKLSIPLAGFYSRLINVAPSVTRESIAAIMEVHPNINYEKARNILNHHPRPLSETLADFLNWTLPQTDKTK